MTDHGDAHPLLSRGTLGRTDRLRLLSQARLDQAPAPVEQFWERWASWAEGDVERWVAMEPTIRECAGIVLPLVLHGDFAMVYLLAEGQVECRHKDGSVTSRCPDISSFFILYGVNAYRLGEL